MALTDVLNAWRDEVAPLSADAEFRAAFRVNRAGLSPADWLSLASMYAALHDVGRADWADCIDKAVLLCARSMHLVGQQAAFRWWGGSKAYTWKSFLNPDGTFRGQDRQLLRNKVRTAAQTRSAFAPGSQAKNFRFFKPDGTLHSGNLYNWARYRAAGQPFVEGERSHVLDNLPPLGRDPWSLPLRPGDVLVFDLRWHGDGGYSGHVPTISYFDPAAKLLAVVEDHLPTGAGATQKPSDTDAFLYNDTGQWEYVPGFNPKGGTNALRGVAKFGCGGIFHPPAHSWTGLAFDPEEGRLVSAKAPSPALEARWKGRNWAGFVGFARYCCRP